MKNITTKDLREKFDLPDGTLLMADAVAWQELGARDVEQIWVRVYESPAEAAADPFAARVLHTWDAPQTVADLLAKAPDMPAAQRRVSGDRD